jgi:integrase/recombinase XerC
VSTTEIYTAGADPALAQAYQAAMARTASPPLAQSAPTSLAAVPATAAAVLPPVPLPDLAAWAPDLPAAIRTACLALVQHRLPTWKPQRRRARANELLCKLARFWRWQLARRPLTQLDQLTLSDLRAYQDSEHSRGIANSSINRVLSCVMALLHSQAEQDQPVAAGVFRLHPLPRPDNLPRHLSPTESQTLDAYVASRLTTSDPAQQLIHACYFVLAHSGLRASECLDLQGQDLDLAGHRLLVRQGKGQRDRVVYLSPLAVQAITAYLQGQRLAPAAPLWTQPDGQPLTYQWLYRHLLALGQAADVPAVSPHRLRHTLATRLLNAGMDITRIQKLLGHEHVTTTQIYARVFDATVEADYRQAMAQIARHQLPLSDTPIPVVDWPTEPDLGSVAVLAPALVTLDNSV